MIQRDAFENLNPYFKRVASYRNVINQLQSSWDSLALLAQMSGTGTEMEQTRTAFSQISNDVLINLSREIMNKTVNHLSSKAYVIINLLVRNLYERTADIGFFSTDDDIRYFLDKYYSQQLSQEHIRKITFRFEEYQKKYTVYENIVLYDKDGKVVHQLDEQNFTLNDQHDVFRTAISTKNPYVEKFYETKINGVTYKSLVYAYPVISKDTNIQLGVLCLCFKFVDELETIFSALIKEDDWTLGLLLDENKVVISSSDTYQIPIGAKLKIDENAEWTLSRFAGREYLAVTKKAIGYQGYSGPGWLGLAMIPIEKAFEQSINDMFITVDQPALKKVMRSPLIFSSELLDIPKKAATIQSKLNQSVWNGNIWQNNFINNQQKNFSKTLLWEVSNTGLKTQNIIETTVSELYQTVVSVMLDNSSFYAYLGVDIMDRNLYERANDVRWWALTYSFRKLLSKQNIDDTDRRKISSTLRYINSLYTVYENLILFDLKGEVLSVSNSNYDSIIGTIIDEEWVRRLKTCHSFQDYVVSAFEATPLYGNRPTYIYAAPIKNLDETTFVGGIGIVFDSEPQFQTMLNDVLPKDDFGLPMKDSFTLFVDEKNLIISSTNLNLKVGEEFNLIPNLSKLEFGKGQFGITNYNEVYFAVGAHASQGYREYKGHDDKYKNKVIGLIFTPLGKADEINRLIQAEEQIVHNKFNQKLSFDNSNDAVEYATFFIQDAWFGMPAEHIKEAIDETNLREFPEWSSFVAGVHPYKNDFIPIVDLAKLIGIQTYDTNNRQIIVIEDKENKRSFGILVSALGEIPYIHENEIQPINNLFTVKSTNPATGVVEVNKGSNFSSMLTIIKPNSILAKVGKLT